MLNDAAPCTTSSTKKTTTTPSPRSTTVTYADSILGGSCSSNSECAGLVGNAICLNRICTCRAGYVARGKMRCVATKRKRHVNQIHMDAIL